MPNIKGIDLSDGIRIISGEVNTPDAWYNGTNLQNYLATHTIAQTETTVNAFLANVITTEQIRIHIFSISPLRYTCGVWNAGVTIPSNWWGGA